MLEGHIKRLHPSAGLSSILDGGTESGKGKRRTERKKADFIPLSAAEKSHICSNELDAIMQEIADIEKKGKDDIDEVKMMLEEVDIRMSEARKETHEFKRHVIIGAENPISGKTMADKFLKYMVDRAGAKDAVMGKLELKNAALKAERAMAAARAAEEEDLGDALSAVDFEQLKIENAQLVARLQGRNTDLLGTKATAGKMVQAQNSIKEDLDQLLAESAQMDRELGEKRAAEATIGEDIAAAEAERDAASRSLRRALSAQADSDKPRILDYIRLKHEVAELEGRKADAARKTEIAEMDNARTARALRLLTTAAANCGSPTVGR